MQAVAEEWRIIADFPDYAVSNIGRLKRLAKGVHTYPGKIVRQWPDKQGYMRCNLTSKGPPANKHGKAWRGVHRLVLEEFVGKCPVGYQGNHKDGIKMNNCIDNLEWATPSENVSHAHRTGLSKTRKGSKSNLAKLQETEAMEIKRLIAEGTLTQLAIAGKFGVSRGHISSIKRDKAWSHITYP